MAAITERGLLRHLKERVGIRTSRGRDYRGILAVDQFKGFYLRIDGKKYRIKDGDQITVKITHPTTPFMEYQIDFSK